MKLKENIFRKSSGLEKRIDWRQPDGRLKIVSSLEALRRMSERGILNLPPSNPTGGYHPMRLLTSEDTGFSPPEEEITGSLGEMGKIRLLESTFYP